MNITTESEYYIPTWNDIIPHNIDICTPIRSILLVPEANNMSQLVYNDTCV